MKHRFFIIMIILLNFGACQKKEEKKEPLDFTEESNAFTADRSSESNSAIKLTDITESSGVDFQHVNGAFGEKWMPETIGSGGGFLDYNNDGWPDIFLINSAYWEGHEDDNVSAKPALYKNNKDGTFSDVSVQAGLNFSIYGMGCSFADFDADGDLDIYITAIGNNLLLENKNGVFKDITNKMAVSGNDPEPGSIPAWSTSSAWVDVDRDGWLDLFVNNYVKWTPETDIYATRDGKTKSYATPDVYQGESCRLYKNIKGQFFEDITKEAGVFNPEGKSLGVAIADFNADLWPDIVVSNDTQPNFLYINNGDGTFANKAIVSGIAYDEQGKARAGMGLDIADIANDNHQAIVIGNFSQEPLSLYTQINGVLFQDRAGSAQLTRASLLPLTFGVNFDDLDNDGFVELLTANGHIEPEINQVQQNITFKQGPQIFYNNQGKFQEISEQVGDNFNTPIVGRGVATADFDKDGDLDVLITVNNGRPRLFRNDTPATNNSITLLLKGKNPNLNAIGAQVSVYSKGLKQKKMLTTGSSYLSQSDISELLIGIGPNKLADSIKIIWPGTGKETVVNAFESGIPIIITEK